MRISDLSSDVCSSDLLGEQLAVRPRACRQREGRHADGTADRDPRANVDPLEHTVELLAPDIVEEAVDAFRAGRVECRPQAIARRLVVDDGVEAERLAAGPRLVGAAGDADRAAAKSEEQTSELPSLMLISYAV